MGQSEDEVTNRSSEECPDDSMLAGIVDGSLDEEATRDVLSHMDECSTCLACVAVMMQVGSSAQFTIGPGLSQLPDQGCLQGAAIAPASALGRYILLYELGAGGMGVVYAAYDPELDRKVAVKIVRQRAGGTDDHDLAFQHRLLREAKAAARISHPNVVAVFDVGRVGGQTFLAMELVKGTNLREWLATTRTWKEIVGVFLSAASGVAAAHHVGLVHRDFKPDNVLLGDDGRVRVADFGLARRCAEPADAPRGAQAEKTGSSDTDHAATRQGLLGTWAYMAPEQRLGRPVTEKSDQFSFCASLWEALYGELPLFAWQRAGTPPEPSKADAPRALRAVLLRGMRWDPGQRFASMDELSDELRKLTRSSRSHWAVLVAAVAVIAVGIGLTAASYREESPVCLGAHAELESVWGAPQRAELRARFMATGRNDALDIFTRTAQVLDRAAALWVQTSTESCRATRVDGRQSDEMLSLRASCLKRRQRELGALVGQLEAMRAASLHNAVPAARSLEASIRVCLDDEALTAPVRPPVVAEERAKVDQLRARLDEERAWFYAAQYAQGLALVQETARAVDQVPYAPLKAETYLLLGMLHLKLGNGKQAEELLTKAIIAGEAGRHDAVVASGWVNLVVALGVVQQQRDEARDAARHAEAIAGRLGASADEARAELAVAVGDILRYEGKLDEARTQYELSLSLRQKSLPADSLEVAQSLNRLGIIARTQGAYEESLRYYERAERAYNSAVGPNHDESAKNLGNKAAVLGVLGRYDDALLAHLSSLQALQTIFGADHQKVCIAHNNIAYVYVLQRREGQAMEHYRKSLESCRSALGEEHIVTAKIRFNIGFVDLRAGRYDAAIESFEQARAVHTRTSGTDSLHVADDTLGLGMAHLRRGVPSEGLPLLERAVTIYEQANGDPGDLGLARAMLGQCLWALGRERPRARQLLADGYRALKETGATRERDVTELEQWAAGQAEHPLGMR